MPSGLGRFDIAVHTNAVTEQSFDWLHYLEVMGSICSVLEGSVHLGSNGSCTMPTKSICENPHIMRCQGSRSTAVLTSVCVSQHGSCKKNEAYDIAVHVMRMSRFRQQPRIEHHERLKKIMGYLANFPHGSLRLRLHEPDYSNLPHKEYDWQRTLYAGAKEEVPHDIPRPKGKHVTTTTYVDANLHHDQVTGRAVTASLHLVNETPSHWHTKRQAAVETATFGSEFVALRIATDQIIDLRYSLMYFGVPIRSKRYMFGDNKSVVDSASIPTSTLSMNRIGHG